MTDTPTLASALVELQASLPHVTKDAENPHFRSRYASLAALSDALLPAMAKLGLAWICFPSMTPDSSFSLRYELHHAPSGERLIGLYPLPASSTPQQIGSAITYARRYALSAVTGLVADDDDDANAAESAPAPSEPARLPRTGTNAELAATGRMTRGQMASHERTAAQTTANPKLADRTNDPADDIWTQDAPEEKPGSSTPDQHKRLGILYTERNITGRGARLDDINAALPIGRTIGSAKELSYVEAEEAINRLEGK